MSTTNQPDLCARPVYLELAANGLDVQHGSLGDLDPRMGHDSIARLSRLLERHREALAGIVNEDKDEDVLAIKAEGCCDARKPNGKEE